MADEGSSLFCDEDETCEKNVSESDEDGEEYVSAPIGEITMFLCWPFPCFGAFASDKLACCELSHPRFLRPAYCETVPFEFALFVTVSLFVVFTFQTSLAQSGDGFGTDF